MTSLARGKVSICVIHFNYISVELSNVFLLCKAHNIIRPGDIFGSSKLTRCLKVLI